MKQYCFVVLMLLFTAFCFPPVHLRKLADEECSGHGNIKEDGKCDCSYGYHGYNCSDSCPGLIIEDGGQYECSGYGDCEEHNGVYMCVCDEYASGDDCSKVCPNSGPDDNGGIIICGNHGSCSNVTSECTCHDGYYGDGCEYSCPNTVFTVSPIVECSNHGTCIVDSDSEIPVCNCNDGYSGEDCSLVCPGLIKVNGTQVACNDHGDCFNGVCECHTGYYGTDCSQSCPGLIETATATLECNGHGTCNPSTLQCTCSSSAWDPTDCGCIESTCGGHGKCVNQQCQCNDKYSGEFCQYQCDYLVDCSGHGICNSQGSCDCIFDYYGTNCENKCDATICSEHGMCLADGSCLCDENYGGEHCESTASSLDVSLILVFVLLALIILQFCLWRRQSRTPRYAEKLKPRPAMAVEITSNPVGGWTCSACTKVNPPNVTRCVVCSTPKSKPIINKPKRVRRSAKPEKPAEPKAGEQVKQEKQEKEKKEPQEPPKPQSNQEHQEPRVEEVEAEREEKQNVTEPSEGSGAAEPHKTDSSKNETPEESGKSEIFSDAHIHIDVSLTKIDATHMRLLLEYSTKGEKLDDLAFNITAPKYVHATADPISATTVEKDHSATQLVNIELADSKPLKFKVGGHYKFGEENVDVDTGALQFAFNVCNKHNTLQPLHYRVRYLLPGLLWQLNKDFHLYRGGS